MVEISNKVKKLIKQILYITYMVKENIVCLRVLVIQLFKTLLTISLLDKYYTHYTHPHPPTRTHTHTRTLGDRGLLKHGLECVVDV